MAGSPRPRRGRARGSWRPGSRSTGPARSPTTTSHQLRVADDCVACCIMPATAGSTPCASSRCLSASTSMKPSAPFASSDIARIQKKIRYARPPARTAAATRLSRSAARNPTSTVRCVARAWLVQSTPRAIGHLRPGPRPGHATRRGGRRAWASRSGRRVPARAAPRGRATGTPSGSDGTRHLPASDRGFHDCGRRWVSPPQPVAPNCSMRMTSLRTPASPRRRVA